MKRNNIATELITHSFNGNEDDATFIEIDGNKFEADESDPTKAKVDDKGEKIPFKVDDGAGDDDKGGKSDDSDTSLEELAKTNPHVAKMLEEKADADKAEAKRIKDAEDEKEEKAKEDGKWQDLAEERGRKNTELSDKLEKKDNILGKYVNSTKAVLADVMKTIPEENRGLVPEGFSPREKLEYITANAKVLGAKVTGSKGSKVDDNDQKPPASSEEAIEAEIAELNKKEVKTSADSTKIWELSKKLKAERLKKQD